MALRVFVRGVGQRAAERPHLTALGQFGEVLADMETRGPGLDGTKLPTDLARRLRLHVEGLVLGKSTGEEDVNDVTGPGAAGSGPCGCQRANQPQVVHPQSHETDGTRLQDGAAGGMIMRKSGHVREGDSAVSSVEGEV